MKYQHRNNGKVMEILKQDDKKGTMLIQYEDGTSTSITTGTFKRWFKKLEDNVTAKDEKPVKKAGKAVKQEDMNPDNIPDDEYVAQVMEQKKELGIECPPIDHVDIVTTDDEETAKQKAEIFTKALEVVKKMSGRQVSKEVEKVIKNEKAKKTKAPKQDVETLIQELTGKVEKCGFAVHRTPNVPRLYIGSNGKNSCGIYVGVSKCVLLVPGNKVPAGFTADRVRNCPLSHAFDFTYSELNKLETILKAIKKEEK